MSSSPPPASPLTRIQWLIVSVAALGFAFDIYELLMMPLIARPALAELLGQPDESTEVRNWIKYIFWASALSGGFFGLIGGYLTDLLGRRRVLTFSILLYAFSALAAGFATSPMMLLVFRCTTFIGVCVEFVAAVAWLAELFPNPRQREKVLGYTQAFSSVGGLLVTGAYLLCNEPSFRNAIPAIFGEHSAWRYTLISGVIPALPLLVIRPFLPESPVWQKKSAEGTLKRPSFAALFQPAFLRTTVVTTLLFACGYGAAFGAIQLVPQIVPGLLPAESAALNKARAEHKKNVEAGTAAKETPESVKEKRGAIEKKVGNVQLWQEVGGLVGRSLLAVLALWIVNRRWLLRVFQIPGLLLIPFVFFFPGRNQMGENSLMWLQFGMFFAGLFTVAQFSFWGNYLPLVYPAHLRGTGEGFSANVGGRMIGTSMNFVTLTIAPYMIGPDLGAGLVHPHKIAVAAGCVVLGVYLVGSILTFFLPDPKYADTHE